MTARPAGLRDRPTRGGRAPAHLFIRSRACRDGAQRRPGTGGAGALGSHVLGAEGDAMSTAGFSLPMLRLPRPTLTAWVLSALAHIVLLAGRRGPPFSAAQPCG